MIWSNPGYAAERFLWPAEVSAREIVGNPELTPPGTLRQTSERLEKTIARYPESSSAARAQLLIGEIYLARKDYAKAHEELQRVSDSYPTKSRMVIDAYKAIAHTYQDQGQWEQAIKTYSDLLSKYPLDSRVLGVPLQLMKLVEQQAPHKKDEVMQEMVRHYRRVAEELPPSATALTAQQLLARLFYREGLWNEAIQEFESLAMRYPYRREVTVWMKMVEDIGRDRLRDPELVRGMAHRFAEKHPAHKRFVAAWLEAPLAVRAPQESPIP